MYNFCDFLSHGTLGNIEFGQSINRYTEILGNPCGISLHKKPLIYKYGILELVFDYSRKKSNLFLSAIYVQFDQMKYHGKPNILSQYDWFPCDNTSPEEIENYFNVSNLPWKKHTVTEEDVIYENSVCSSMNRVVDHYVVANSHIYFGNALL